MKWIIEQFTQFSASDWMRLFAGMQATYSAVCIAAIFAYSFFTWKHQQEKRLIVVSFTFSHLCLILCTTISMYNGFYTWKSLWYWMYMVGYIAGDFVLLKLWVRIIKISIKKDA